MSENRYGEKREESETGMKLQNCETQESENKVQESTKSESQRYGTGGFKQQFPKTQGRASDHHW